METFKRIVTGHTIRTEYTNIANVKMCPPPQNKSYAATCTNKSDCMEWKHGMLKYPPKINFILKLVCCLLVSILFEVFSANQLHNVDLPAKNTEDPSDCHDAVIHTKYFKF